MKLFKKKVEIMKFDPCKEAVKFRKKFKTFEEAWNACERGDWMLWIAYKYEVDKRKLTLAKALCAKTVIHLMKDERSINAIKVAEDYGNGIGTDEDLKNTATIAYKATADAAAAADVDAAAYAAAAAYNAAYAAASYAAAAASYAAAAADVDAAYANAAYAAYANASYTAADAAIKENLKQTADICRSILTEEILKKVNE